MDTLLEFPTDMLSDYDDGYASMTRLMRRMSASAVVAYAEDNGPRLDELGKKEGVYYCGLADALASQCAAAEDRIPGLKSQWLKGSIVHVEVNGRDKTFRVERRTLDEGDQDQAPLSNGTHLKL